LIFCTERNVLSAASLHNAESLMGLLSIDYKPHSGAVKRQVYYCVKTFASLFGVHFLCSVQYCYQICLLW